MASISSENVAALFPFSFTVDHERNITNRGESLAMLPTGKIAFSSCFDVIKPEGLSRQDLAPILKGTGDQVIIHTKNSVGDFSLAGTFIPDDAQGVLFIGSPLVKSEQELIDSRLQNSDFGMLDRTKDLMHQIEEKDQSAGNLNKANASLAQKIEILEANDTQLNNFFNLSLDFMCLANTEGYFTKVNPTFCSVLGYTEKELLENSFLSFVHPDDLPSTLKEIEKLAHGQFTINFENRYRKADGTYIVMNWNCRPDAATGLLYATARDMTEHNLVIQRENELVLEKERAEMNITMLRKLLPPVIVKRFQSGDTEIADYYPQVSVLFADIVDFSSIVKLMPPMVVRDFLTSVFEHFDSIVARNGCEKIKTIGDGYMVIAGAPETCEDHAERLTSAALEMIKPFRLSDEMMAYFTDERYLSFRIGMHVGAIVGGVLGNCRPMAYDIWGDTVNIASRMQSTSEQGKIHVTSDFVMHLKDRFSHLNKRAGFKFEKRGYVDVKHMGKIFTYYIADDVMTEDENARIKSRLSAVRNGES